MARTEQVPVSDWEIFCRDIEPHLKTLDVERDVIDSVKAELFVTATDFMDNRELDAETRTAGHLERELLDLALLSESRLEKRLTILDGFELATFFGELPGAAVELSIDGYGDHLRLLPEAGRLPMAAFKTLTRLGDTGVPPSGLVYRRRAETIADRIPPEASIGDMARFVAGLTDIILNGDDADSRKERRIRSIMNILLTIGSLGSAAVRSAITDRFFSLGLDGKAALVVEITSLCLQDAEMAGIAAHALTTSTFREFLKRSSTSERRATLTLFANSFPDAFVGFTRFLAERVKLQYRLVDAVRSGRRDARRWHEAHAGWKLIDAVLDTVWPTRRHEPDRRQRAAVAAIVTNILALAGVDGADRPTPAASSPDRPGNKLIRAAGDDEGSLRIANLVVNADHVDQLVGLRSGIHKLDTVLGILDRRALFELEPKSGSDPDAAGELADLRCTIEALQLWRSQLQEKREFGDYERVKVTEPRATGARMKLPRMPQVKGETLANDEAAIAKIITAAHSLRRLNP